MRENMANEISIRRPPAAVALPDNGQWTERFEIRSETSDRIYIIARNKNTGKYGCSCPAYLTRRYCKHLLQGCGLDHGQIHGFNQMEDKRANQRHLR